MSLVTCYLPQALLYSALSSNISSEEPIDVVMHEAHPEHKTLWENYKQVFFDSLGMYAAP
jgi:hypothetical protein